MKKTIQILLFHLVIFVSLQAQADQIAFDLVKGEGNTTGIRLSYQPYEKTYTDIPIVDEVLIYFELSANYWQYGEPTKHQTGLAVAFSPVVTKPFAMLWERPLSWELGIGVSLVDRKEFAGKNIGSHFQFEDRIGLRYPLDNEQKQIIAIRYMHYSNGGLNSHNSGLNFLNLSYAYRF